MDNFIGEIRIFGGNFAPANWAFCWGQLLPIAQNTALFSLLGTTYGGNGTTTFALPDLRGRTPIGQGNGPGLSPYVQGQVGGVENVTLLPQNLPPHAHQLNVVNANAANKVPNAGDALGVVNEGGRAGNQFPSFVSQNPNTVLNPASVTGGGGNQAHSNMQPYLTLNYIIALQGIYPSRQ